LLDLAFRDESSIVIKKAKAKARKCSQEVVDHAAERNPKPPRKPETRVPEHPRASVSATKTHSPKCSHSDLFSPFAFAGGNPHDQVSSVPLFSIHPTIDELGINYFINNFVAQPSGPSHGHFHYVPDLCRQSGMNEAISASLRATGLAALSNVVKSSQLMGQARRQYISAIRSINSALKTQEDAAQDSILLSIMAISMFENITGSSQLSVKAWTEHVNGASTILKLRGRSQLRSKAGFSLFIHVTSHLLISCVQRELPMPPPLMELRLEAFSMVPPDPGWRFLKTIDAYCLFRSAIREGTLMDSEAIIAQALKFDDEIVQIFSTVPAGWIYETVYTDADPELIFNGSYDIYYDHWIAQLWNAMRVCRIMLNQTIRSRILHGLTATSTNVVSTEDTAQFQLSTSIAIEMRDGILRSIPQHIGYVIRKPFTCPSSQETPPDAIFSTLPATDLADGDFWSGPDTSFFPPRPDLSSAPLIGGYFLLWPLYVAGMTSVSTATIREYVASQLRYIGDTMGIKQGNALANFLEKIQALIYERGSTDMDQLMLPLGKLYMREILAQEELV
jgi:hypothetical protein